MRDVLCMHMAKTSEELPGEVLAQPEPMTQLHRGHPDGPLRNSSVTRGQVTTVLEPEPDRIVHGEPWIRQQPDLDPAKPDPDPDVAGSRSGQTGSRSGCCRI